MTESAKPQPTANTIDRALQTLAVTRQPDENPAAETVFGQPGYYTNLAREHARSDQRHSG